ncbi:hypothetical protein ACHAXA_004558 [Cyclostephanos tholiformis]|uniref:Uncharacterized protein n=1 Tax=Cyclostephanos tholiformis TaxID=382380 RepID=A0ABD3RDG0_9STRA
MTRRRTKENNMVVALVASISVLALAVSSCSAILLPSWPRRNGTTSRRAFSIVHLSRPRWRSSAVATMTRRMAIVGGDDENKKDDDDEGGEYDPLNEWIRRGGEKGGREGEGKEDEKARRAEGRRLPISYYGAISTGTTSASFGPLSTSTSSSSSSSLSSSAQPPPENPYLSMITRPSPSDLISRFTSTAPTSVQDAVRTTILGLIGGMASQMKFDTRTIATGERLANLMFQLQMTGYMFKNAEYRLGISQGLGIGSRRGKDDDGGRKMLPGEGGEMDAIRRGRLVDGGRIRIRYGGIAAAGGSEEGRGGIIKDNEYGEGEDGVVSNQSSSSTSPSHSSIEVEVDARAYMSELRREVKQLRLELEATKLAKEEEMRKDLLAYIRSLPKDELRMLTGTMSPEVLDAMKGLVSAVLSGIGEEGEEDYGEDKYNDGDDDGRRVMTSGAAGGAGNKIIGPNTVTEQSGEALAQLCMWQLVVGYNLRELEVREEFRVSMSSSSMSSSSSLLSDEDNVVANEGEIRDNDGDSDYDGLDEWR